MSRSAAWWSGAVAALYPIGTLAAEAAPSPMGPGNLLQVVLGLGIVLALLLGGALVMKRIGRLPGLTDQAIKTVAAASVGTRERVVLLEVADSWILIGVAPGQVRALATLPKGQLPAAADASTTPAPFAQLLQRFADRRNAP